jgi:hypothetical protein
VNLKCEPQHAAPPESQPPGVNGYSTNGGQESGFSRRETFLRTLIVSFVYIIRPSSGSNSVEPMHPLTVNPQELHLPMSFSPALIVAPLPPIGTSHSEHDGVHQFDFAMDEDVIMSEASRNLGYESVEYVRASSVLLPPRDITVTIALERFTETQSQSVAFVAPQTQPPIHSDTNEASGISSNKKR